MAAGEKSQVKSLPSLKNLTSKDYGRPSSEQDKTMQDLVRPHIESFNFMLEEGLLLAVQSIPPSEFMTAEGQKVSIYFTDASIGVPTISDSNVHSSQMKVFPTECRESGSSYKSKIQVTVQWKIDNEPQESVTKVIAYVPMMVKSNNCSLARLSPKELVQHHEEAEEAGGYFIINGNEKIIRMLILPRRNYPMALVRSSWKNRGTFYTEYGIQMRSVRKDETAVNMVLHYLNDGSVTMAFGLQKELFYVPVVFVLKALMNTTDHHIYKELIKGEEDNTFLKDCVSTMLRTAQEEGATNQTKVLEYIGERFRIKMKLPEWYSDEAVAKFLIKLSTFRKCFSCFKALCLINMAYFLGLCCRQCICVHLETNLDKFNMLTFMTRKLYSLAFGKCAPESADSPMMQEVLLGGHLYLMVLKEKLEQWLQIVALNLVKASNIKTTGFVVNSVSVLSAIACSSNITHQMEYLMATGNLISRSGLALLQGTGFTLVADRLNMFRFISHFRCVHRGAFFSQMRTTSVRKLLPEAWGFLCPVHTPDGAPCGLLNHLAAACQIVNVLLPVVHLQHLLSSLGMIPHDAPLPGDPKDYYPVLMDGRVLGSVERDLAPSLANRLRVMKILGEERVPPLIEICLVPKTKAASQYPALFIFTKPARMMRPVTNLATGKVEMIGTFEQVYMDIAVVKDEVHEGITTHLEIKQTAMLSAVASMTPFSDFNQSPRNMYQCQMGKQTMGTPVQAFKHRTDNKLYRIQTPQSPLVRPTTHDEYCMDNYPLGTNAIVAVISYTGYDMEDAMILNKSSYERGFAHGSIYKTQFIDLSKNEQTTKLLFGCLPNDPITKGKLDSDGLPPIGSKLENGDPLYSYIDSNTGEATIKKYTNLEPCIIDDVKILGNEAGNKPLTKVCVKMRIQRNPIIGDKFSSRHGQKGICSQKWPAENMPFSESGMTPDIIFNPHGFPSRMTIGMMIESMAGKSASLNGHVYDATPFQFSEDDSAIDYFGKLLVKSGYDYFGTERLYSGIDGREFEADIFMGVVYYQRLRHMVADKFQVRTTGPIDTVTHQPVQGRRRQGGIRFGEMERDALLAHGTSFLLQDRLMNCSDRTVGHVCSKCGSLLSSLLDKPGHAAAAAQADHKWFCKSCNSSDNIQLLTFPYVFRYLVAELAAMNIKTCLDVKPLCSE